MQSVSVSLRHFVAMASLRLGELLSVPDEVFEANPQEPRIWWDATVVRVLGRCGQAQVELFFPHDGWKVTFKETEAVQWLVPFVPAPPKASSDLYLGQRVELYWAQDRKWFKATITQFMAGAAKNALLLYDDATVRRVPQRTSRKRCRPKLASLSHRFTPVTCMLWTGACARTRWRKVAFAERACVQAAAREASAYTTGLDAAQREALLERD